MTLVTAPAAAAVTVELLQLRTCSGRGSWTGEQSIGESVYGTREQAMIAS